MIVAIICSTTSTFKVLLKTHLPKMWSSAGGHEKGPSKPHARYNESHSGQFEMRPFGGVSNKSISNRKYGIEGLTEIGNESEEAVMRPESKMRATIAISTSNR